MTQGSWHHDGLFMGMHFGWWLFWIVMLALLAWAFWRLAAERREVSRHREEWEDAEEILRQRFARGEIDEEEFSRRLKVLDENRF